MRLAWLCDLNFYAVTKICIAKNSCLLKFAQSMLKMPEYIFFSLANPLSPFCKTTCSPAGGVKYFSCVHFCVKYVTLQQQAAEATAVVKT